jgi:hypothetical protein
VADGVAPEAVRRLHRDADDATVASLEQQAHLGTVVLPVVVKRRRRPALEGSAVGATPSRAHAPRTLWPWPLTTRHSIGGSVASRATTTGTGRHAASSSAASAVNAAATRNVPAPPSAS